MMLAGCGEPAPDVPRSPATSVTGQAVIRGVVKFDGTPPQRAVLRNEPCCPGAPPTQLDDSIVINGNGTLANVFVYLEGGPKTEGSMLPAPVLDQVFCQYTPHVIGVVVGQPLTLRSSDPTLHNVAILGVGEPRNYSMKTAGETAQTSFKTTGFAGSKCDVHPWMNAVIGVFDNPLFSVSGMDGGYEISNVPDGQYTLVARHERYGSLRQPITVKDGQAMTADFRYHPPTP
jgi:plastocyanin